MRVILAEYRHGGEDSLRRILLGEGLECEAADAVVYDDLPARLAENESDLVLVHCEPHPEAALLAIRSARQVTSAPILACGQINDAETVRDAMRNGAREFLALDRIREELGEALLKIEAESQASDPVGINIALFSPSGGAGVSTTAVNLATRLAGNHKDQGALVDLKAAPSDISLLLDLETKQTTNQVLRNWERLDRKMLKSSMTVHDSGLHVLPQEGYPDSPTIPENFVTRTAVRQALVLLRRSYRFSVLDLDHALAEPQFEAMRLANFVGLIVRPDVPGLRRARWAIEVAISQGISRDRFRLVLNRYGGNGQIQLKKVEEILGIQVFQSIPEDVAKVSRAANQGVPLHELSRMSRISRSFSSFAREVETMGRSPQV